MTELQKKRTTQMRHNGIGYGKISSTLGISVNSVKSYCLRNQLDRVSILNALAVQNEGNRCKQCGREIQQVKGRKPRKFCSDICRMAWWNKHAAAPGRKNTQLFTCRSCGRTFYAYGKRERKYCCRSCYGKSKAGKI